MVGRASSTASTTDPRGVPTATVRSPLTLSVREPPCEGGSRTVDVVRSRRYAFQDGDGEGTPKILERSWAAGVVGCGQDVVPSSAGQVDVGAIEGGRHDQPWDGDCDITCALECDDVICAGTVDVERSIGTFERPGMARSQLQALAQQRKLRSAA